jgi:hypothetical protein
MASSAQRIVSSRSTLGPQCKPAAGASAPETRCWPARVHPFAGYVNEGSTIDTPPTLASLAATTVTTAESL